MGAWGCGNFENDDALDFLDGLSAETAVGEVQSAMTTLIESSQEDEGAESWEAGAGLAAAELVAAALGRPGPDLPEDASNAVRALESDAERLRASAREAAVAALERSELRELWGESDELDGWTAAVQGLIARLDAATAPQ